MQLPSVTFPAALLTYFPHKGRILLNTKSNNPIYCVLDNKLSDCVCVYLLKVPGEKTLELKRISKMMSLTEPTSLHAARTACVALESPAMARTLVRFEMVDL